MGRTEPSIGQPPASFRRGARAKKAKATINQLIPSLLTAHPRARKGIDQAELILEPKPFHQATEKDAGTGPASENGDNGPSITLQVADTLTAARSLLSSNASSCTGKHTPPKVAILNMASPLSPGGGFLNGASSQEESLCMRTTLLPSLKDNYYRLPELGAIYTPDVLVFRNHRDDDVLAKSDRYFVNCISAAMLKGPDIERGEEGWATYVYEKDRELVLQKMRVVLRICQLKGVTHVVLGAWGCGAYGNPVNEIASAWRKVLFPRKDTKSKKMSKRENWAGVIQVVFAIKDPGMADSFETAFGDGLVREEALELEEDDAEKSQDPRDKRKRELEKSIRELEERIQQSINPSIKEGLSTILSSLTDKLSKEVSDEESVEQQ